MTMLRDTDNSLQISCKLSPRRNEASDVRSDLGVPEHVKKMKKVTTYPASKAAKKQTRKQNIFLEGLYKKYSGSLCSWLRSRYGNGPPDPEDLAQSAFEKISHVDGLAEMSNPRAYLFTVAARNALDELRGLAVRRKYIHQVMVQYGDEVGEITPERVYSAREDIKALTRDIKKLSAVQREVVMRSRLLGQTYDEIKAETGWSSSAISRHLQNAMVIFAENRRSREKTIYRDDQENTDNDTGRIK